MQCAYWIHHMHTIFILHIYNSSKQLVAHDCTLQSHVALRMPAAIDGNTPWQMINVAASFSGSMWQRFPFGISLPSCRQKTQVIAGLLSVCCMPEPNRLNQNLQGSDTWTQTLQQFGLHARPGAKITKNWEDLSQWSTIT